MSKTQPEAPPVASYPDSGVRSLLNALHANLHELGAQDSALLKLKREAETELTGPKQRQRRYKRRQKIRQKEHQISKLKGAIDLRIHKLAANRQYKPSEADLELIKRACQRINIGVPRELG